MRIKSTRAREVLKFLAITAASFLAFEAAEHLLLEILGIDLHAAEIGWLAFVVTYGLKTHVLCCLVPLLWAAYKCRHRGCGHGHCEKGDNP